MFAGAFLLGVWDGVKNGFGFLKFFARFIVMLYGMEIYDIMFFDWFLLCHSNFFPHFYPELKGIVGPHMFVYNKKTHIVHFIFYIPISAVVSLLCTLFKASSNRGVKHAFLEIDFLSESRYDVFSN